MIIFSKKAVVKTLRSPTQKTHHETSLNFVSSFFNEYLKNPL